MNRITSPKPTPKGADPSEEMRDGQIDVEQWLHIYEQMLKIRYFEETVNELYKTARMPGLAHLYSGEEAIAVGVCEALKPEDYITSTHRGHGDIIGKGGSTIRKIQEETQTEINVEDDGSVEIAAVSGENSRKAIQWIESLTREVEVGALYLGKVTRIMGFGAFVEIRPGNEGLVRIGELADYHVPTVEDVVSVGDEVMVVVTEVDRQGRINLSRKAAMQRHLAKDPV